MTMLAIDLTGRLAIIIGGGEIGGRKAESLLDAGAKVRVISPEIGLEPARRLRAKEPCPLCLDALQFTDPQSVKVFLDRLLELGRDARALHWLCILASTPEVVEELRRIGYRPDAGTDLMGLRLLMVGAPTSIDAALMDMYATGSWFISHAITHRFVPRFDTGDLLREALAEGAMPQHGWRREQG